MTTSKTKTQQAIDYIFAHPGTRSNVLSGILQCQRKDVPAYLKDVLASGLIVSCGVETSIDGTRQKLTEYRPSASAPAIAPDFKEWRKDHLPVPADKPLTPISAIGRREKSRSTSNVSGRPQPAVGSNNTGSHALVHPVGESGPPAEGVAVVETQGSRVMAAPEAKTSASAPADSDVKPSEFQQWAKSKMFQIAEDHPPIEFTDPQLFATLSIEGAVHIAFAGREINLPAFAVRELYEFLEATHPAFN